jgi:hypothetical protein
VQAWAINLSVSVVEDILVVHAFRVYLVYSLSMVSIRPQLKYIYRVLNKVAISYTQDELADAANLASVRVVQTISPACRASRLKISDNLATGNILRHIDDVDVAMCSIGYGMGVSRLAVLMFSLPLLMAFLSEALGDLLMETIFPPVVSSILMCNYFLYASIGVFVFTPYLLVMLIYLWKHKVHKISKRILLAKANNSNTNTSPYTSNTSNTSNTHNAHGAHGNWARSNRKAISDAAYLRPIIDFNGIFNGTCLSITYYITRPLKFYYHLRRYATCKMYHNNRQKIYLIYTLTTPI